MQIPFPVSLDETIWPHCPFRIIKRMLRVTSYVNIVYKSKQGMHFPFDWSPSLDQKHFWMWYCLSWTHLLVSKCFILYQGNLKKFGIYREGKMWLFGLLSMIKLKSSTLFIPWVQNAYFKINTFFFNNLMGQRDGFFLETLYYYN